MGAQNDSFPPESIKELIGELVIAIDRSTDPANKISLTSSRISKLIGVLDHKCKRMIEPGLRGTLYKTLEMMLEDMSHDTTDIRRKQMIEDLYNHFFHLSAEVVDKKKAALPHESLQLFQDYNIVLSCRKRWQRASDVYMQNHNAWSISNKILADINDALTIIEIRYNLMIKPKNLGYNVTEMGLFNRKEEQ
jgi:hypothetical protein